MRSLSESLTFFNSPPLSFIDNIRTFGKDLSLLSQLHQVHLQMSHTVTLQVITYRKCSRLQGGLFANGP